MKDAIASYLAASEANDLDALMETIAPARLQVPPDAQARDDRHGLNDASIRSGLVSARR